MTEPLQTIKEALNTPIEAVAPTQFDDEAIGKAMAARNGQIIFPPYSVTRNAKPNLKDEVLKGDTVE